MGLLFGLAAGALKRGDFSTVMLLNTKYVTLQKSRWCKSEPKQPEVAWFIDRWSLEFSSVWAETFLIVRMKLHWSTSSKHWIQIIHERAFRWKTWKGIAERKSYMHVCTVQHCVYKVHLSTCFSGTDWVLYPGTNPSTFCIRRFKTFMKSLLLLCLCVRSLV